MTLSHFFPTKSSSWPGFLDLFQKRGSKIRTGTKAFPRRLCVPFLDFWRPAQALSFCHVTIYRLLFPFIGACPESIWFLMMAP